MTSLAGRDFLQLAGFGSAVFASALAGCAAPDGAVADEDFYFVRLSDAHWGFEGPPNPDAKGTLPKAIATVNALPLQPDFVIFTGDPAERRRRMAEFRRIAGGLAVKAVRFIAGDHDASLDHGAAFREFFGPMRYSFDHKGMHFIAIDNVSDPSGAIVAEQLAWLADDLKALSTAQRIVVFTHRPLSDLAPQWDWATRDGHAAIDLLLPHPNVTVFYGHIHQENHHLTGHIAHHSAKSPIFALPAPGSQPKRTPLPWDPAQPYRGLGPREVEVPAAGTAYAIHELPVTRA